MALPLAGVVPAGHPLHLVRARSPLVSGPGPSFHGRHPVVCVSPLLWGAMGARLVGLLPAQALGVSVLVFEVGTRHSPLSAAAGR